MSGAALQCLGMVFGRGVIFRSLTLSLIHCCKGLSTPTPLSTKSAGLISFTTPPESVEEMMSLADAMMDSVKLKGKNSIAARVSA